LITLDTYRVAAVDQLRTYAEIIDLPLEVVATPEEMREAIARLADLDLILLDTAGLSPGDPAKIHELEALLGEVAADEVHLVLSCASSSATLARAAEYFRTVGANRLILTKVDEAQGLGNLLPLLCDGHWPLSYLSGGQEVPGDIAVANAARLAGWILPDVLQPAA
jgi:flagellar biosynthesis protein FlhF